MFRSKRVTGPRIINILRAAFPRLQWSYYGMTWDGQHNDETLMKAQAQDWYDWTPEGTVAARRTRFDLYLLGSWRWDLKPILNSAPTAFQEVSTPTDNRNRYDSQYNRRLGLRFLTDVDEPAEDAASRCALLLADVCPPPSGPGRVSWPNVIFCLDPLELITIPHKLTAMKEALK